MTLLAEKGSIVYRDGVPQISMHNGSRQEVSNKSGRFSILYFDYYNLDFISGKDKAANRFKNPGERSLTELLTTPRDKLPGEKIFRRFRLEGYKRLALPFYNLSFMLIAAAGLLTGNFNRRGHAKRIVSTVLIMAIVQVSALGIDNLCMRAPAFLPLLFIPAMLPTIVCLYVLKHAGEFDFSKAKTLWNKIKSFRFRAPERLKHLPAKPKKKKGGKA